MQTLTPSYSCRSRDVSLRTTDPKGSPEPHRLPTFLLYKVGLVGLVLGSAGALQGLGPQHAQSMPHCVGQPM